MEAAGIAATGSAHVLSSVVTVPAGSGGATATAGARGADAAQPSGRLPQTGSTTTGPLAAGATVLVGFGAALVIASRRRGGETG